MTNHVFTAKLGFVTRNDSGVVLERNPDTVRGPDVAYWSRKRMPEPRRKGWMDVPPDLILEVLSPNVASFFQTKDEASPFVYGSCTPSQWCIRRLIANVTHESLPRCGIGRDRSPHRVHLFQERREIAEGFTFLAAQSL